MKIKDIISAKAFEKDGFFVIEDFFDVNTINEIQEFYDSFNFDTNPELNTNIKSCTKNENIQISDYLKSKYELEIDKYFDEVQLGGGVFIMKGSGEKSISSLHQDFNVVDEQKYKSITIWCPLIDVDEQNGCMQFVKGSHQWFNSIRSFNMPTCFLDFHLVSEYLVSVSLKKGSVVVFNHSVFHGSKPNYSQNFRPAAAFSLLSKDATPLHYWRDNKQINVYQIDEDFYNEKAQQLFSGKSSESLHLIDSFPFKEEYIITEKKVADFLSNKKSVFQRIKTIFNHKIK